jgi:Mce-associated membrane protein
MTMTSIATKRNFPGRTVLGLTTHGGPLRTAALVVAVVAVVAFAAAGWFGVSWYRAAHDKSLALGMDRDAVLRDAQLATFTLNTLDYRRVQDGLTLWEQSAAGPLLTQLKTNRATYVKAITDSMTTSTAKVLDAAVAALDERSGTAQVFVGVDVTSQSEQGDPSCVHRRARLDMIRAGNAWKAGALDPVGDAYSEAGPCAPAPSPK